MQYTDNVRLSGKDEESDLVGQATAILNVARLTYRTDFKLYYSASFDTYVDTTDQNGFRQEMAADGTFELVRERLFLDAAAAINETKIDDDVPEPAIARATTDDSVREYVGTLSPYLTFALGERADLEIRGRVSGATYEEVGSLGGEDRPEDTYSYGGGLLLSSPARAAGLTWSSALDYSETDDGDTQTTFLNSVSVPVLPQLRVIGRVGYEQIENDEVDEDREDNVIWSAGLEYEPDRRVYMRAEAGQRFDEEYYDAEVRAAISTAFNLRATYTVALVAGEETSATDPADFNFDDPDVSFPGAVDGAIEEDSYIENAARIELAGSIGRTAYTLGASYTERDFDIGGRTEELTGLEATIVRDLTRNLAATLSGGYTETTDSGPDEDTETVYGSLGVDYDVGNLLTAGARYAYREQTYEFRDTVTENAALVQLTKQW